MGARIFLLTSATMIAFAGNSVLARLALIEAEIGAGSFALIRLISGGLFLALLLAIRGHRSTGTWRGGFALMIYAVFFAYAYITLPTGTGALILFAIVQFTMIGWGYVQGERLKPVQIFGASVSVVSLVLLVSPGLEAPSPLGTLAMIGAGIGWGAYSILGRGTDAPIAATSGNFLRASLLTALALTPIVLWYPVEPWPSGRATMLAVGSGAITSGLGYALWYTILPYLTNIRAGLAQLSVPAFAAVGGVIFLSEPITLRMTLATTGILGGVALAVLTLPPRSRKADT